MKEEELKLLNRKEISVDIDFSGITPKKDEIKKRLANSLKVDEELVVVKKIVQRYGGNKIKVFARVYKDKNSLDKIETIKKKKKEKKAKVQKK